jgi:hypothetical protein
VGSVPDTASLAPIASCAECAPSCVGHSTCKLQSDPYVHTMEAFQQFSARVTSACAAVAIQQQCFLKPRQVGCAFWAEAWLAASHIVTQWSCLGCVTDSCHHLGNCLLHAETQPALTTLAMAGVGWVSVLQFCFVCGVCTRITRTVLAGGTGGFNPVMHAVIRHPSSAGKLTTCHAEE